MPFYYDREFENLVRGREDLVPLAPIGMTREESARIVNEAYDKMMARKRQAEDREVATQTTRLGIEDNNLPSAQTQVTMKETAGEPGDPPSAPSSASLERSDPATSQKKEGDRMVNSSTPRPATGDAKNDSHDNKRLGA